MSGREVTRIITAALIGAAFFTLFIAVMSMSGCASRKPVWDAYSINLAVDQAKEGQKGYFK